MLDPENWKEVADLLSSILHVIAWCCRQWRNYDR